jgi:hypothetical protein
MKIETIKGSLMDLAPTTSEAIAIWMCSGFNTRNSIWRFELKKKGIEIELIHPEENNISSDVKNSAYEVNTNYEPWRLPCETLWKITNDIGKLKYIYVFPNPEDKHRLDDIQEIDQLINKCLGILKVNSINSVSFILIPALPRGEHNTEIEDLQSAKQMIYSIQNWLSKNGSHMQVYLVDRVDGFKAALDQIDSA